MPSLKKKVNTVLFSAALLTFGRRFRNGFRAF